MSSRSTLLLVRCLAWECRLPHLVGPAILAPAPPPASHPQAKNAALDRLKAVGAFRTEFARLPGSGCVSPADLDHAFGALLSATMRRLALEEGWRCDGRGPIDLRQVHCEVGQGGLGWGVLTEWRVPPLPCLPDLLAPAPSRVPR